jgi:hypothetical protein
VNGDESVGEAREPRRGAWRTAVRRYHDDLVYGPTTASSPPSRVDDAASSAANPLSGIVLTAPCSAMRWSPRPRCLIPHILRYSLDATVDNWTSPSMAESQLAELQNMRRRRKHQRVRARGHGVPAQVSTNGPLVLCG